MGGETMQIINLSLYKKTIIPVLYVKQGDVGRKFQVVFADGIPDGVAFSAWYSGASGEGNYTHIGDRSAFAINGNTVTVELITQMLTNAGEGKLCLVMSGADGSNLASWNIPYVVEHVPGMGSDTAAQYFTAFSEVIKDLPYPDVSLTAPGKAADAAAVGAALAEKNKLLWINDSPTSSFGELTVPLDMSDVSFVAVASIYGTIILQKGQMGVWGFHDPSNVYTRAVTVTEDGVQFGECIRNGAEAANEIMVPQSIWKFAGSIPTPGEGSVDDPSTNPYIQALAQLQEDVEDLKQHGGGGTGSAVLYTEQNLTEEQKAQARENIGAVSVAEVADIVSERIAHITNAEEVSY